LQVLNTLTEEKARIALERDAMAQELAETRQELDSLGVEGGAVGLAKQLVQLSEERAQYKALAEKATSERDALIKERHNLEDAISQETERGGKMTAMEAEIVRLMQDREALAKSRGSLKNEYQLLLQEREQWQADRARMLAHNDSLKMELEETLALLSRANEERHEVSGERSQLNAERDTLRAELTGLQTEYDTLLARLENDRERLETLNSEGVGTLTGMIEEITRERTDIERALIQANEEAATLKRQLEKLSTAPSIVIPSSSPHVESDAVISVAQELRTPLSVIMGYTDVLLGESVGILGALQRQFLTRVKANVDRLARLVEDLIRISTLDSGNLRLHPQKLNLVDLIDDAITNSRYKFGEKGIVLDMDIPEDNLPVEADPEAIQQVINQLIQNAYLVSPNDGSVRVVARRDSSPALSASNGHPPSPQEVIFVAISDEGGGIPPEELRRVFSGMYRADSPLIAGLGETGAGMSIARALIEAHGGKIWVESTQGIGNTFKFVLPSTHPYTPAIHPNGKPQPEG
jgi:signal transduction histidine kinase